MRSTFRVVAVGVVAAWCLSAGTSAQTPAPPPAPQPPSGQAPSSEQRPTFRTGANFVRVDVYPTHDGKPVEDLTAADFEVLEDGARQKIDTFEHVVVSPAGPQTERIEPSSQREMLQAAENPRNRVFVVFLDTTHVAFENSYAIVEPLIRLINRVLGPDDLVGLMTPDMSASEVVLARRTEVTEERLRTHWHWGERFANTNDPREDAYEECYAFSNPGVAAEMIARKRERETLEALQDLVRYLNGIREERKAILTVTQGWMLFGPNPALMKPGKDPSGRDTPPPAVDPVGVGPTGKLTTKDPRDLQTVSNSECDSDRLRLSAIDDAQFVLDIVNDANRSNVSFYPINPRGLVVFESDIKAGLTLTQDAQLRRTHQESMRTLADSTDGITVMDSNDLDKGLRRIADDLTSYYLLGYNSTNARLDGRYRSLKVRVTRPGVAVRARRGYRAATVDEVSRARTAAAAPALDATAPLQAALGALATVRPDSRVRLRASPAPDAGLLWIAGELSSAASSSDEWRLGATVDLQVSGGTATAGARVPVKAGDRTFLTSVKLPAGTTSSIDVQARVSPSGGGAAAMESIRVAASPQPLFYRRGPTTANRQLPTADLRFTRADRAHLELPVSAGVSPGSGRLLDRTGQALAVPVTLGERTDDATGQRWITADLTLAPLAPADYAIEIGVVEKTLESRILTGIRITR